MRGMSGSWLGWRLGSIAATLLFLPSLVAGATIGTIDNPGAGATYSGVVTVSGFVISQDQITRVDLYVDNAYVATANKQLPRTDILDQYPEYRDQNNLYPGFVTSFNSTRYSNGSHTLFARAFLSGSGTLYQDIGRRTIGIDNTVNQAPFGWLDLPAGSSQEGLNGAFQVIGWALDNTRVERVDVLADGYVLGSARYGGYRADVAIAYPDLANSGSSGFSYWMDSNRLQNGTHQISVRVWDEEGASSVLANRTVQVFNIGHNQPPFGELEHPLRDTEMYGNNCGLTEFEYEDTNFVYRIVGYTLDVGSRDDPGGVGYVELLLDNVIIKSSRIDCGYFPRFSEYMNCYGLPRLDVQQWYPGFQDSPNSGFVFGLDVGYYLSQGWLPGHHTLKIRAGDLSETSGIVAEIPVTWVCSEDVDESAIGFIDSPRAQSHARGTYRTFGWALDVNGIAYIEVFVDGVLAGNATYGFFRPDVGIFFPEIGGNNNLGWHFDLDTTQYGDSRHDLVVRVTDFAGRRSIIGERQFFTDNNNP